MNRNAFTLVELLTVLTIIGVISLITVPIVSYSINTSKEGLYKDQEKILLDGAVKWAMSNTDKLPVKNDSEKRDISIPLGLLKAEGYIDNNIKNPLTGYLFPNDLIIKISFDDNEEKITDSNVKYNGNYKFELIEDSGTELNIETDIAAINLNICGSYDITNLTTTAIQECINNNLNKIYAGYGVNDVTLDYYNSEKEKAALKTYNYNNMAIVESIDMTRYGFYYVYYLNNNNNKTSVKIVMINDLEAPKINFDINYQSEYNDSSMIALLRNVSCTDNSGYCELKTSGNINPSVKGKYVISYIANDKSGNTTKTKQVIVIK